VGGVTEFMVAGFLIPGFAPAQPGKPGAMFHPIFNKPQSKGIAENEKGRHDRF
jgi:hypothetical protein